MNESMFGIIIGVAGTAVTLTNGVIIWLVAGLRGEFNSFRDSCRVRHEVIPLQSDLDRLDRDCQARHERDKELIERNAELFTAASHANAKNIENIRLRLATANGVQNK